ncbi:MAG: hypothetical protein J0M04_02660 [Verrucomicrobia bacterium]|nr:hypothetical protein [Verrucomicrobiota bacterium]
MKAKWFQSSVRPLLAVCFTACFAANSGWAITYTSGNGFEYDTGGWPGTPLVRTASGTGGVTSSEGGFHAIASAGAFTRWGGYQSDFPAGGYTTSLDIYLDVNAGVANDTRFDYSSAVSKQDGTHLRDYVFNVGFYNDTDGTGSGPRFVVSTGNNAPGWPKNPGRSPHAIVTSGWYTFEHVFADVAGVLSVTLNIKDSLGNVVASWAISDPGDLIASVVGGNRYGWFPNNGFAGGLAVDRSRITSNRDPKIANITRSTYHLAISSAQGEATVGDTIRLAAGTYSEGALTLNKELTIQGPNQGKTGTAPDRVAEARISNSRWTVAAAGVTIDGLEIYQTDDSASPVSVQASNTTVSNSVVCRVGVNAGQPVRGIEISPGLAGYSITGNLFTGDSSGGFFSGHKTWNSGMYVNGGAGTITGNTFENCRTAINLDDFNSGITLSGNTFRNSGTYLSFGGVTPTSGQYTIAGNEFFLDWANIETNWLPSAILNNSNVAPAFRIDATGNTFGGVATADLSNDQKFQIEGRMVHRGRSGKNGVVDFVANQQVVVGSSASYTITAAIGAAPTGGSVLIGPGTYTEDILVNKPITLGGAGAGTTILNGIGTTALGTVQLTPAVGAVTIEKLTVVGLDGPPGLEKAAIYLQGNQSSVTIRDNTVTAKGDAAIQTEYGAAIAGLIIEGNTLNGSTFNLPGTGGTAGDQFSTPNWPRSLVYIGGPGKSNVAFTGNTVEGVSGDGNNSNVMVNIDAAGATITGNTFAGNNGSRPGVGLLRARGSNTDIQNNTFSGLSAVGIIIGSGSSDTAATSEVTENSFVASYASALVNSSASSIDATKCYWGAPNPNFAGVVSGTVSTSPWYADAARTILVTAANFEDATIPAGSSVVEDDLYIGPGSTHTVLGSLEVTGDLTLAEDATLEVVDGSLTLNGSTIAGTFTFFNSFGSVNFDDDVSITGSAEGLILVSDVHVADGATVTVDGKLVIDGCVMDSTGRFNLAVNSGADFTMARTVVTNGDITVNSADTAIYDNRFATSTIGVGAGASAARIYHNLTDAPGWITGTAVTEVDGWGNVAGLADTNNNLSLDLDITPLLATGRTKDTSGNIYVQPTDEFKATLDVSKLQTRISALEVLLGYNTGFVTASRLNLASDWDVEITGVNDASTMIGKIDGAIGLSFDFPDPDGTSADQNIASVDLTGTGVEGETLFFHRVKMTGDAFGGETRLTTGGADPAYLAPFTINTGSVLLDGTAPTIAVGSSDGKQEQANTVATVDVLDPVASPLTSNYTYRNNKPVVLTFTATDAGLSGLDAADAANDLVLSAGNGTTTLNTYTVSAVEAAGVVNYTVTLDVPTTATNGTYAVTATVRDRSGNVSPVANLGSFKIASEALATVELQSFVGGVRTVEFTATNALGAVLGSWTKSVTFTGAQGTVPLENVPTGTAAISAKTAWNLRSKKAVSFSPVGVGTLDLTGTDKLPGGDINGDNVVNTLDYSKLRYFWNTDVTLNTAASVADITGDGVININDYNQVKGNFYTTGDAR